MAITAKKRQQIRQVFEEFIRNRAQTIRKLKIDDFRINPFLLRILSRELGLDNSRGIVLWLFNQRMERGTVTSFGTMLQEAAKVFSEGTGVEGADILKTKGGRHHHIQVKSGPNTIPKDLGVRISQLLNSARRRNRGSVALFGMCYGNKEQVSSIVRKYVEQEGGVEWITGREFWEFISDDPACIDEIYRTTNEVSATFKDEYGQTLKEIVEAKLVELQAQFEERYGQSGDVMWAKLLELNS